MQGTQAKRKAKGPFRFFLGAFEAVVGFEVEGTAREEVAGGWEAVEVDAFGDGTVAGIGFVLAVSFDSAADDTVVAAFSSSFGSLDPVTAPFEPSLGVVEGTTSSSSLFRLAVCPTLIPAGAPSATGAPSTAPDSSVPGVASEAVLGRFAAFGGRTGGEVEDETDELRGSVSVIDRDVDYREHQ
jgi:hypothetical protein